MARSAITGPVPPELAIAEVLADAQSDPESAPYLLGVAAAIAAGYVAAGYDRAGRFVYEATEAGRRAAQQAVSAPLETPDVLTCSAEYADRNRYELARHVRSGGVVRIVDLRRRKVIEYRSQELPACIAGMPDDLPALWQAQHERWSAAAQLRQKKRKESQ